MEQIHNCTAGLTAIFFLFTHTLKKRPRPSTFVSTFTSTFVSTFTSTFVSTFLLPIGRDCSWNCSVGYEIALQRNTSDKGKNIHRRLSSEILFPLCILFLSLVLKFLFLFTLFLKFYFFPLILFCSIFVNSSLSFYSIVPAYLDFTNTQYFGYNLS